MGERRRCQGTNEAGKPCGAIPLKPGTVIEGVAVSGAYCRQHDPDLPSSAKLDRVRSPDQLGGRPRNPRAIDVLKDRMERDIDQVLAPLFDALRAEKSVVVGNGPAARVETVPDIPTRIAAARELLDRGYGRPKQVVDAVVVSDEDVLERIALMEDQLADFGYSGEAGDDPEVSGD